MPIKTPAVPSKINGLSPWRRGFDPRSKDIGLDVAKWDADRSSNYLKGLIKEDMELVSKLRISGVPFFFGWVPLTKYALNSQGAVTEESFESILNELRSNKAMRIR
ncbi:hypothetical protein GCM10022293_59640 [Azospirillum formosense]